MPGGLLQIASSGIQDVYLTKNPEITFFKKVYRRSTNFATEFHKVIIDESIKYGDEIFINIPKYGDLIHKSFIHVELPKTNLNDSYITNPEYILLKKNKLEQINNLKNLWKKEYDSLSKFSNIMIIFYKKILILMKSQDITYEKINTESLLLRNTYNETIKKTVFNVDEDLLDNIDIFSYVINFDRQFGLVDNSSSNVITINTFLKNIQDIYNNNIKYLKYYHSNYIYYTNKYNDLNSGTVDYAWIKNLGHYYFSDYKIEIDGMHLENYTDDYLNIFQSHNLKHERIANYDKMIGNTSNLTKLHHSKETTELYIPLIFWFNRNSMNSLPLVSMKHSMITLNLKIAELHNLLYFTNFDTTGCSNYAFPILLMNKDISYRNKFENYLSSNKIEFRRGNAGGGNQLRQPYLQNYKKYQFKDFRNVDFVHFFGYYIGNYPELSISKLKILMELVLLGDLLSIHLAEYLEMVPEDIDTIEELKKLLEEK